MAPACFKALRNLFRGRRPFFFLSSKLKISEYQQAADTIAVNTPTPDAEAAFVHAMLKQNANGTVYLLQSPPNIRTEAWEAGAYSQADLRSGTIAAGAAAL
jgi:hypothetical protein